MFNSTHYDYVYNPQTQDYDVVEVNTEETYELPSELIGQNDDQQFGSNEPVFNFILITTISSPN